tara:strand:- start:335 stop:1081 length:747 start_codon:yes stop_codon:yes gene_type:complete
MHNSKILIGNSGDKVFLQGNKVIKEAGHYPEKFKQQMDFLLCCDHPNFIDIKPISETSYEMKRFPTWYDKILEQPLVKSFNQLEDLIGIIGRFDNIGANVKTGDYFDKLQLRTGYTYEGKFDATSSWGFVHGDLTVSNMLYDKDFLFIDPRGTEEQDYYDYGKLMQSFVMEYESHIYNNPSKKYSKFCKGAEEIMYEWCDEYQLKFFLAVHLLGAVPFFELNERYELAGRFLTKGHELFDELEIKYTK